MLKFLLILIIAVYLLSKLSRMLFVFRVPSGQPNGRYTRKPSDGNVNIDNVPKRNKQGSEIKGGEYVDYEEVK